MMVWSSTRDPGSMDSKDRREMRQALPSASTTAAKLQGWWGRKEGSAGSNKGCDAPDKWHGLPV